jgi:PAS domain S-box-containing protein
MHADESDTTDHARRKPGDLMSSRPNDHHLVTIATALIAADGRILHWSADAEALLGYPASEAVGSFAARFLVGEGERREVLALFDRILAGEDWTGTYAVRHRDGHLVSLDFRTYQIASPDGPPLVLATAFDVRAVNRVEADLAVLDGYFTQSPIGMAVYDNDLRFVRVNSALAKVNGRSAEDHLGRRVGEVLPGIHGVETEAVMRRVLETGEPVVDARSHGRVPGDPDHEYAWSASYSRLQDPSGRVLGVSSSVIDITERYRAEAQAARARERLAQLAEASAGIGTTLDLRQTAHELVTAMVPEIADLCGVLILEGRLGDTGAGAWLRDDGEGLLVRRLAFSATGADFPFDEVLVDAVNRVVPGSPYAEAMATGRTVVVSGAKLAPLTDNQAGRLRAYFDHKSQPMRVVPLVARGTVLGMVVYSPREDREPLDDQDIALGDELAARAAVSIDNALLYLREHETVMARQAALQEANAATERLALLNDASIRIGTTLDLQRTAEELVEVVLPRFADFATVDLLESVMRGDEPSTLPTSQTVLLHAVATGEAYSSGLMVAADTVGEISEFDSSKIYAQSLRTGRPILIPHVDEEALSSIVSSQDRVEPGIASNLHSYLMVPLLARGEVLGGAEFIRMRNPEPFNEADVALAEELVARAAVCVDNARLYRRERATALTLQRSLLPQEVHRTLGMEIAYRYLPSSVVSEVGGDWFDVVPLSSGRVALVVGDVMGHGIRAAATMGQLRTVARTLATLDMEPEQVLTRLDETASGIGEGQFATCVCAVYDPVDRSCIVSCAGHLPPVVVSPDGTTELIVLPPGVPLGVGGVAFESVEFTLPENGILALYTDGLVERRGQDIDQGIDLLRLTIADRGRTLEETCDAVLSALVTGGAEDDIAVIMAQALPLRDDKIATLPLSGGLNLAGEARRFTRATLDGWGLSPLCDHAELLVSELVTNALLHAAAPRQLRLFRDRSLTVEVADADTHTPRLRSLAEDDEGGRGMHLVNELAHRWGSRTTRHGKVVWFELELPLGSST